MAYINAKSEPWNSLQEEMNLLLDVVRLIVMLRSSFDSKSANGSSTTKMMNLNFGLSPEAFFESAGGDAELACELAESSIESARSYVRSLLNVWKWETIQLKSMITMPDDIIELDATTCLPEIEKVRDACGIPVKFECVMSGVPVEDVN